MQREGEPCRPTRRAPDSKITAHFSTFYSPLLPGQHPSCCRYHLVHSHGLHTPKIQGALAQEAWAAFHMMPQDDMPVTNGAGQARLS